MNDCDCNFYGFDVCDHDRGGYKRWFYQGDYDFFRFDKRGFGSIRLGYVPRPNYDGWCRNSDNWIAQRYYLDRRYYENKGNNRREHARENWNNVNNGNNFGGDLKRNNDDNRNRLNGNDNGVNNSQGNNDNIRNDRIEMPNNRPNNNGNGFLNGGGRPERIESNNGDGSPSRGGRPERADIPQSNKIVVESKKLNSLCG